MSSLQKFIDNQAEAVEQSLEAIASLQRQLNEIQGQVRVQQQISQAQKTANKEVEDWLKQGRKLFKDLCSIYPAEALEDLAQEVVEMSQEVKENYNEYQKSARFLKGAEEDEDETETDAKDLPVLVENLPDIDDDTQVLFASQIEVIISEKPPEIIDFIRQQFNISGRIKKMSALTRKLAENQLTRKRLEQFIKAAELTTGVTGMRVLATTSPNGNGTSGRNSHG
ncbi:hypothetical protein [Crocosphaera chwakensis]|uniref:Uncharacterized protein n=1 Tax=Crocosphaera chwakensis CCY0110 TaxID=391612 RepID=A3ITV7_9CHRO|nr:hypothetical protein [Crocosphaera chwakensis]EAZ90052.1 hypothetical protein CY0110_14940 [Crocosphaera chwakensis CCY0110]